MRGRKLYLAIASASFENALEFVRDAEALRRRGSRGHSYSLVVLGIEEAAKSYTYKLAGEGIFRIVSRKPNGVTSFSEDQLSEHKFKHQLIARLVIQGLASAPVAKVLAKTRKAHFSRAEVARMLADVLHQQQLLGFELRPERPAGKQFRRLFETLEKANGRKNSGFYVDTERGKVRRPNDCPKSTLREAFELADLALGGVGAVLDAKLSAADRRQNAAALREALAAARRVGPAVSGKGPQRSERPAAAPERAHRA